MSIGARMQLPSHLGNVFDMGRGSAIENHSLLARPQQVSSEMLRFARVFEAPSGHLFDWLETLFAGRNGIVCRCERHNGHQFGWSYPIRRVRLLAAKGE